MMRLFIICTILSVSCKESIEVPQWTTYEIKLTAVNEYNNPYTEVNIEANFINSKGDTLLRPGFWDGGNSWKIRFSPPKSDEAWTWSTFSNTDDKGLTRKGKFIAVTNTGNNELIKNGLLKMSKGKRNAIQYSGKPFPVIADTPWAIPFRATKEQVEIYSTDRQEKGFNTALLMSLQPDMKAEGPNARNVELGFALAFSDLSDGHIQKMDLAYFQYLDSLIAILIDHEIVPVYQPVFHGFGWKGLDVLGNVITPDEYVRYCKYLLARYGSMPAMWLIAGDNGGNDPGVKEAGEMLEKWDCYGQPTGLHYNPCDDFVAEWAVDNPLKYCMHYNKVHQSEKWLDFQWAQTGHGNEHNYKKVFQMYENKPIKASANGEPTYEGMGGGENGLGWWQGEEAWMQLMSGGTMGVVYGAASLWQWKISAEESGWGEWASQQKSWSEAMQMEGSRYVGLVGKILKESEFTDIERRWDLAGNQPLLAKENELYIAYLNEGGSIKIESVPDNMGYSWINPKDGKEYGKGSTVNKIFEAPDNNPWLLIIEPFSK